MINQKNTLVSFLEQVAVLNKNAVEIIASLNSVVTDRNSVVGVEYLNSDGTTTTYYLPTVGQLKTEIDLANSNIQRLAGLVDNNVYITDGTTSRKVYVDDLNREPEPINDLNKVTKFVSINNSFFEALSNPLLAVNIDLTGKIDRKVDKVLSRRYIVKFQKDDDGNYTSDAETSKADFEKKFLNQNNIFIEDFLSWYNNVDNYGLLRANEPYDEQVFSLDYAQLESYGVFDVLSVDNDTINNKMWYTLGSLTYYALDGTPKQLNINDYLITNKKNSATKWRVKEVSTALSKYRVILERVEGLDPVAVMSQSLKIYSPEVSTKSIKVSIGFDEYNVIFIKPINTDANILSSTWSYGTCFYSNNLSLDSNESVPMNKYYTETVFDYGTLLKDMITKVIPSKYGKKPNAPNLNSGNFKVIQINKHLTDVLNANKLKELYAQKSSVKSQLEQLNDAIVELTKEINTSYYKTYADKQSAIAQLNSLISQQETTTKLYYSLINQISALSSETTNESPKYRIRGFWNFPDAVTTGYEGYQKKQEVIQFEVQYRYGNKNGADADVTGIVLDKGGTGYFSPWVPLKTDVRKRKYNSALDFWYWEIEDVSDADTPNVNQLDIPIQPNERVEIKIRSISEVGWPDAALYSDWSNIMSISFPDDLGSVGTETDMILQSSTEDTLMAKIESTLNAKGLSNHLQQSFWFNDEYIAHMDDDLGTNFKDANGRMILLKDYLISLTTRIQRLEEQVSRAKGELVVKLFKNIDEKIISNGAIVNVSVVCEDYAVPMTGTTPRRYYNDLPVVIRDFYLEFKNIAKANQLGLVSSKLYAVGANNKFRNETYSHGALATYVDSNDLLHVQKDNQYIWISDTSGVENIYHSGNTAVNGWKFGGVADSGNKGVLESNWNLGLSGKSVADTAGGDYSESMNIFTEVVWTGNTDLLCTVHPYIESINDFIYAETDGEKGINPDSSFKIPINIYFQMSGGTGGVFTIPSNTSTSISVQKKLRFFLEPVNISKPFEFEIVFRIYRNRTYNLRAASTAVYMGGSGAGMT